MQHHLTHKNSLPHVLHPADGTDVTDQPIRMRVRGQSSAVEYAKKSFSLDPVDQINDLSTADTTDIPFLGMGALAARVGGSMAICIH